MGMNVHKINSNKYVSLGTLAGSGNGETFNVPAATIGILVDETASTADIAIEVSIDGTNFYPLTSPTDLSSITTDAVYSIDCPFPYIRASNNNVGTATIYMTW